MSRRQTTCLLGVLLSACALIALAPALARAAGPATPAPPVALRNKAKNLYMEGKRHFTLHRFRIALGLFTRAYDLVRLPGFLYNIAQCHRFLGNYEKAVFFYQGYLRDNHGAPNAHVVRTLIAHCRSRLKDVQQKRDRSRRLFDQGRNKYRLGEMQAALKLIKQAYTVHAVPAFLFHIGECYRRLKKWNKAVHAYQGYLKDNPGTPEIRKITALIAGCKKSAQDEERKRRELARRALLARNATKGLSGRGGPLDGLAAIRKPKTKPFYKRWWFWTAVSVGVAAAATGLGYGLWRRQDAATWKPPASDLSVDLRP